VRGAVYRRDCNAVMHHGWPSGALLSLRCFMCMYGWGEDEGTYVGIVDGLRACWCLESVISLHVAVVSGRGVSGGQEWVGAGDIHGEVVAAIFSNSSKVGNVAWCAYRGF
jgi:hypothetical protein